MPTSKLPPIGELDPLRRSGMTDQEIADWVMEHYNTEVSRQAVSTAFYRAGKTQVREKYDKTLPWRVKEEHAQDGRARVLRWLGRRMADLPLTEDQNKRVDSMLRKLKADNAVIIYRSKSGFHTVDRDQAIHEYGGRQPNRKIPIVLLPDDDLRS